MDVNKLMDINVKSLDTSNEKLLRETRGDVLMGLEYLSEEIEKFERRGKKENALQSQLHFEKLKGKINKIDGLINNFENGGGQNEPFQFGQEVKTPRTAGKSLTKNGSIKLYAPDQKLMADSKRDEVGLGDFLRSVIDKPRTSAERTMIQNSVDSSGYSMPNSVASELIDNLRAVNPVIQAGARTISIDGLDSTKFVKIDSDPNAVWHTELTEESFSDPTFGAVEMKPKTVLALTEISREVLQDAANMEEALTASFVGSLNQAILAATFSGSAANEPTGLASLITQTNEYANAGDPDWSNFVGASKTLHDQNVPADGRSFVHAPDIWEKLALATDTNGRYQDAPSFIRDVPNFVSSGVPVGIGYAGDFSNVVYGFRMNITLEQHNASSVRKYGTVWLAAARLDIACFRPNAFVRVEEAAS